MTKSRFAIAAAAAAAVGFSASFAQAAPYASGVQITGTNVSFILNEPSDLLTVSINGGAPIALDGSTAGTKIFSLGSTSDTFSITAQKTDAVGYTIPTGGTTAAALNGLSQTTNNGGFNLISSDANNFVKYNSPRGVTSQINPNQATFGNTYVSNSAAGATGGRTLGDGLYAIKADQSDAFGYGDTAKAAGPQPAASSSTPFRVTAGSDGLVYIADFSDGNSFVTRSSADLNTNTQILSGSGGPSTLPPGSTHGSITAIYPVIGPSGLTLYTVDEDLTTNVVTGSGSTTDKNSLWRYNIGNSALPFASAPTRVNQSDVLTPLATSDLDIGLVDGKFYLAQNRSAGNEAGVVVLNPDGTTAFDSLSASRALLSNPTAADILRNVQGMAVSPDQHWLAVMLNNSDVAVLPLVNGVPDLANRLLVDTGTDINSGRDIAFDAAGNIIYVSSGQGLLRVLSPGGFTSTTLSYDPSLPAGQQFAFVPEPTSLAFFGLAGVGALARRRRRA
jgi:hypothetical protein